MNRRMRGIPILLMLLVASATVRADEQAPEPEQVRPEFGVGEVSPTGGYAAAVALSLPPPRGDLPLPVSVRYAGGQDVGAAGLGWDVSLSYVRRSTSLARRKPHFGWSGGEPVSSERITVSLNGALQPYRLVSGAGSPRVYRPIVGNGYAELVEHFGPEGDSFTLHDGALRTYTFERPPKLDDEPLWVLTRITDRTGENHIELVYETFEISFDASSFWELDLVGLRHTFSRDGSCPKHEVRLRFREESDRPLSFDFNEGFVRARSRILDAIEVWTHGDSSCAETSQNLVRTYGFTYVPDTDTQLPRLAAVDLWGQGVTSRDPADSIPVARYGYGSATNGGLTFVEGDALPMPAAPPGLGSWGIATDQGPAPPRRDPRRDPWDSVRGESPRIRDCSTGRSGRRRSRSSSI